MIRPVIVIVGLAGAPFSDSPSADRPALGTTSKREEKERALVKLMSRGRGASMRDALEIWGASALLFAPEVQDELGMTEDQIARGEEINKAYKERLFAVLNEVHKLGIGHRGDEADRLVREAMPNATLPVRREREAALLRSLEPAQRRRLWEIALRVEGPLLLAWPGGPEELELTPEQRAEIGRIRERFDSLKRMYQMATNEILYMPQGHGARPGESIYLSPESLRREIVKKGFSWKDEQVDEARDRANRRAQEVLTPEQRGKLDRLRGAPYDVSDLIRPGGGRWRPEEVAAYRRDHPARKSAAGGRVRDQPRDSGVKPE